MAAAAPSRRILHCFRAPVGGLFRHVLDLAAEQAARGHQVGFLADATTGDRLTEARLDAIRPHLALGITRIAMPRKPGLADANAVRETARLSRTLDLDVLHGHGAKGGAYARLARQLARGSQRKLTAFYTPHGGSLNYSPGSLEGRVFLAIERGLFGATDGLIFESAFAARIYAERVRAIDADRSRIVPNGLQPADFVEIKPEPDATDFLFVGELREVKGVDVLLRALASVAAERPVSATIVGSGPDAQRLAALASELGLGSRVRFPGAMPARDAFRLGRVLVVPSLAESFPYIVLEAGAAAMPLLTTGVGGIPEMVAGTDTPMLPAGDAFRLARHMREALSDPAGLAARAQRFKTVVGARYTVAGMTDAVLGFYDERLR